MPFWKLEFFINSPKVPKNFYSSISQWHIYVLDVPALSKFLFTSSSSFFFTLTNFATNLLNLLTSPPNQTNSTLLRRFFIGHPAIWSTRVFPPSIFLLMMEQSM